MFTFTIYAQKTVKDTLDYEYIFGMAIKGEITPILNSLDTLQIYKTKDLNFKDKFEARFKYNEDLTTNYFAITDTLLNPLHRIFQKYWRQGLLHPEQDNDSLFKVKLINFFNKAAQNDANNATIVNHDNLDEVYKRYIESKGYYCTDFGKAGKFYDFLVWRTMEPKKFKIELVDHTEEVTVYFMKDFISLGWMEYSRLGERYPGGWATNKALYCVSKGYNQSSEKFKIVYLKHEGQHFYDYKRFPGLESRDLEYRGKLIEMIFCNKELYNRVAYYLKNAKNDPRNAHPHANYRIVTNMSQLLFGSNYETDFNRWKKIPKSRLQEVAKILYVENTKSLFTDYAN